MINKKEERQEFLRELIGFMMNHPVKQHDATPPTPDEEVRQFIELFMEPTYGHYNRSITSYGLKHAAERTIGYLFYGSDNYHYVSNDQFKRVINDTGHFAHKPDYPNSPNDIYRFRWKDGAMDVLYALGVYGTPKRGMMQKSL